MTTATASVATTVWAFRAKEGCQAHVVVDPSTLKAMVIDPRLDQVDEILDRARPEGVHIRYVLDTHTHADHLSGVRLLSARTGAGILAHPKAKVESERVLEDGDVVSLGEKQIHVIHSSGHTPDSLSLLVDGHLFTGDALFAGGAGRTDFMGGSAGDLFDSFRKFEALPGGTVVHPGHDYVGHPTTTIESEKTANPLMREHDRESLIGRMSERNPLPRNMKPILAFNTRGPSSEWISPLELDATRRLRDGVRLIDIRNPDEYASRHIEGSLNIPLEQLSGRVGEIAEGDTGSELVIMCQSGMRSREAVRVLRELGQRPRQLEGGIVAWTQLGLPTEGRGHMPIEQQVRLAVGTVVLVGSALTAVVSPWFLIVPAFLGAGLAFSGVTGRCSLAWALGRMPWNRHSEEDTPGGACSAPTTSACAASPATTSGLEFD